MAVDFRSFGQDLIARQSQLQGSSPFLAQNMSVPDPSKQFPPLAPGPTPRIYAGQSSVVASRSKKNSTACLPCKAAKRKVRYQPLCGYNVSGSMAPKQARGLRDVNWTANYIIS